MEVSPIPVVAYSPLIKNSEKFKNFLSEQGDNLQLLFLCLVIAVMTFPEQPLVSLALVIGPLIELLVLSVISGILKRWNQE